MGLTFVGNCDRQATPYPILFLMAKDDDLDIGAGLAPGADDYVIKTYVPEA